MSDREYLKNVSILAVDDESNTLYFIAKNVKTTVTWTPKYATSYFNKLTQEQVKKDKYYTFEAEIEFVLDSLTEFEALKKVLFYENLYCELDLDTEQAYAVALKSKLPKEGRLYFGLSQKVKLQFEARKKYYGDSIPVADSSVSTRFWSDTEDWEDERIFS